MFALKCHPVTQDTAGLSGFFQKSDTAGSHGFKDRIFIPHGLQLYPKFQHFMKPLTQQILDIVWRRVRACFWLKTFGIPAFMAAFFLGYFLILNNPLYAVTVMPLTFIDRLIPYQNSAWILYVSLWLYVQIPPTLIEDRRELVLYGVTAGLTSLVGFTVFFF